MRPNTERVAGRFESAVASRDAALVYGAATNAEVLAAQEELREARKAMTAANDPTAGQRHVRGGEDETDKRHGCRVRDGLLYSCPERLWIEEHTLIPGIGFVHPDELTDDERSNR